MSLIAETPAIIAFIFLAIISAIVGYIILDNLDATGSFDSDILASFMGAIEAIDNITAFFFFSMSLLSVFLAFQIRTHPILFIFTLLVLMVSVLIAAVMKDVYVQVASADALASTADLFPLTYFLFDKLPIFALVVSFMIGVATFAKPGGG